MNEFTGKSKEELEDLKISILSYKQGCIDSYKLLEDLIKDLPGRVIIKLNQKITLCQEEINKINHD